MLFIICLLAMTGTNSLPQNSAADHSIPVDSGYVIVDGGKLYYEIAGKGPDIILIHDGMVHRVIWDEQFQWLAKNYRIVRYDRQAYGKSYDSVAIYSHIDDLNQVFIQLKIDRAIVFEMSSGGVLAIDFTLKYPEKVHKYYIMDDPYEIYKENTQAKERVMELMKPYLQKDRGAGIPLKRADRMALRFLPEIQVSTLILVGEYDVPDVHAHAGAINAGIEGSARKIIPKSGHLIPIENRNYLMSLFVTF